jgi:hypothetical protein
MTDKKKNSTVTEMKKVFGGFISKLFVVEERLSELNNVSTETFRTEKQRKQRLKKKNRKVCPRTVE